ncbi:hypothetical protein CsatA_017643 [Cannabis sativa]
MTLHISNTLPLIWAIAFFFIILPKLDTTIFLLVKASQYESPSPSQAPAPAPNSVTANLEEPQLNSLFQTDWFHLDLSFARLEGVIPPGIGALSKLTYLDLSHNAFTGRLPLSLTNLSRLVKLDLSFNQLNNSITQKLGNLKNLVELNLGNNILTGAIPSSIGF